LKKILCSLAMVVALGGCQIQENKDWDNPLDPKVNGMVLVPGIRFQMGSPVLEPLRDPDETLHWVSVSSFLMDSAEVTQQDFQQLMGFNLSNHAGCRNCPVENVTWFDAVRYCNARSRRDGLDTAYAWDSLWLADNRLNCDAMQGVRTRPGSNGYRLPTEAQWERAARGDSLASIWHWGSDSSLVDLYAWRKDSTRTVGTRLPNGLGLHDMAGNVREWTNDRYAPYPSLEEIDPTGPATGDSVAARGGSISWDGDFSGDVKFLRSANRNGLAPLEASRIIGFRCVRPLVR